jgi:pilus assembly protein CpaB
MAERRYTIVFYTAIVVALAATYWVYRFLERTKENAQIAMQPVVVVTEDLPEGARLERGALAVNPWPVSTVPPGAFSVADSVVGRVTRVPVFRGEPIVPGRLAPPGTGSGLEVKITPGKRAMSVKINEVVGLAGLIQPNSRVDVLVTLREEGENSRARAKLFMNNMRVLSVGTQVERGEDGKPISATTATLEVTPDEAERLAVAANQGSIQLVLRGYGDPDSVRTPGATSADVLAQLRSGGQSSADPTPAPAPRRTVARRPAPVVETPPYAPTPPPAPAARRADSAVVEVYRGSNKVQQQKFDQHDSTGTSGGP